MLWDIFCRVIDNHGDAGVCWRLSAQLALRGHRVRLRIDDPAPLSWMAPGGAAGVEVLPFTALLPPGDVVVEAFGCELPDTFQAAMGAAAAAGHQPPWVNLEYLTAEAFAERNHQLPSPVMAGPARGALKRFFYPGFTARTGGLLREPGLSQAREAFDPVPWLLAHGIPGDDRWRVSLFSYEPAVLEDLLAGLAELTETTRPSRLLVTAGRSTAAVNVALDSLDRRRPGWNASGHLAVHRLELLPQADFDRLLWSCDLNFVRGEDSLVRALWAGRPFVWQLYPQDDGAHHDKLEAFLARAAPPAPVAEAFRAWNGVAGTFSMEELLSAGDGWVRSMRSSLAQEDLVTQLERFVAAFPPSP